MSAIPLVAGLKYQIRFMRENDLPQVLEIDRQSFSMPWPASAYHYELFENQDSLLWVAETDDSQSKQKVIGMIVVWFIVDEAHIATIAVDPQYRQRGVARDLLSRALKTIVEKGYRIATLEVRAYNAAAQNLYRSFDFQVVGFRPRYYRDNNEDALIMTAEHLDKLDLDRMNRPASADN